jgi:hypothetical protein
MNNEQLRKYNAEYRHKNREKIKQQKRAYYESHKDSIQQSAKLRLEANGDSIRLAQRTKYKNNPVKAKEYQLRQSYGFGIAVLKQMFISQNGCCSICKTKFKHRKQIHVDHNHTTGEVRELLCRTCNVGIGHFLEDVSILTAAIEYLNRWNNLQLPPEATE